MKQRLTSETSILLEALIALILALPRLISKRAKKRYQAAIRKTKEHLFTEQPGTNALILLTTTTSIIAWFLPSNIIDQLVLRPSDLASLKLYTLITAGLMHANITHLAGNMLALFVFGRQAENALGKQRLFAAYLGALIISGLISSAANHFLLGNDTPGLGASGAVMGVVAIAMLAKPLSITYIFLFPLPLAAVGWLYLLADLTGLTTQASNIGHLAHLGGFASITLTTYLFSKEERRGLKRGLIICFATLIVMLGLRLLLG